MSVRLAVAPSPWRALAARITDTMGLHFARLTDLRRGFHQAVGELGFESDTDCARWVLEQPPGGEAQQVLARHLTVGETYFFRDPAALEALQARVLVPLIAERRHGTRHLRIWCAACCTGEEAYTVAILLHRLLPDLADWDVTIAATDINEGFLRKAEAGSYGEWSFRDAPAWLRAGYFSPGADGRHTVRPHIRRMVRFAAMNLVGEPGLQATGLGAMDVILCRNVLMYFSPPHIAGVVDRLAHALLPQGCLLVGSGESACVNHPALTADHAPGAILFRKGQRPVQRRVPRAAVADFGAALPPSRARPSPSPASPAPSPRVAPAAEASRRARALADEGRLAEAMACCDHWIESEPLSAEAHYVRAMVLLESGNTVSARHGLRRALYADVGFVAAHVAMGHLERGCGSTVLATRHFMNARQRLEVYAPQAPVPGFDGLTAHQLMHTLERLCRPEDMP